MDVTLPDGWLVLQHHAGIRRMQTGESLRLFLEERATTVEMSGQLRANAVIDIARIAQADWTTGTFLFHNQHQFDYVVPATWRSLAQSDQTPVTFSGGAFNGASVSQAYSRRLKVPAAGDPMRLQRGAESSLPLVTQAIHLAFGPERMVLQQRFDVPVGPSVFALSFDFPPGWRYKSHTANVEMQFQGVTAALDSTAWNGGAVVATIIGKRPAAIRCAITLERAAPHANAHKAMEFIRVNQVEMDGSHLRLSADPSLQVEIRAPAPWQLDAAPARQDEALADVRVRGEPPPLSYLVQQRETHLSAESLLWLMPYEQSAALMRLDLRLQASAGSVETCTVPDIFGPGPLRLIYPQAAQLTRTASGLSLQFSQPWQGSRFIRIEGAAPADGAIPRMQEQAGVLTPSEQIVAVQVRDQLVVAMDMAAEDQQLDVDALPAWSAGLPSVSIMGAWRLAATGRAQWRGRTPSSARMPKGFIDDVHFQTQIGSGRMLTLMQGVVAAPGQTVVDVIMPENTRIIRAQVDGQDIEVRYTDAGLALPLPGRTATRIAIQYEQPLLQHGFIDVAPLALEGLHAAQVQWSVAASGDHYVAPQHGPDAIPLSGAAALRRPWFGTWPSIPDTHYFPDLPAPSAPVVGDERILQASAQQDTQHQPLELFVQGRVLSGTRLDSDGRLQFHLYSRSELQQNDDLGRWLALAAAICALWFIPWRAALLLAIAGGLTATAMHALAWQGGPLLACAEWVLVSMSAVVVLRLVRSFVSRQPRVVTSLLVLLAVLLSSSPAAMAAEPVLMGYQLLDDAGRPQLVRVAVERDVLLELRDKLAQKDAAQDAVAVASTRHFFTDHGPSATIESHIPVALAATTWRPLILGTHGLQIGNIALKDVSGSVELRTEKQAKNPQQLVMHLRGTGTATIVVSARLRMSDDEQLLSLYSPLGGTLTFSGDATRVWLLDDRPVGANQRIALPMAANAAQAIRRLRNTAKQDGNQTTQQQRIHVQQDVLLHMGDGRFPWQAKVRLTVIAGSVLRSVFTIPEGLRITDCQSDNILAWGQEGNQLRVQWRDPVLRSARLQVHGFWAAEPGREAHLSFAQAERRSGRLHLAHGAGGRWILPKATGVERTESKWRDDFGASVADLAVSWSKEPEQLPLFWQNKGERLWSEVTAQAIFDGDRVAVVAQIQLGGDGQREALRLRLPAGWRVHAHSAQHLVERMVSDQREVVFRQHYPWNVGQQLRLQLVANPNAADFSLPNFDLIGGPSVKEQTWVVGDTSKEIIMVSMPPAYSGQALPQRDLQQLTKKAPVLPGIRTDVIQWRWSGRSNKAFTPQIQAKTTAALFTSDAQHYMTVEAGRARWFVRVHVQPRVGAVAQMSLPIPESWRLQAVSGSGISTHSVTNNQLNVAMMSPLHDAFSIELEFYHPFRDHIVFPGFELPGVADEQHISLAHDCDGIVRLTPEAMEKQQRPQTKHVPTAIDGSRAEQWRATGAWSLALSVDALQDLGGVDGVAPLVDIEAVVNPDGDWRARARWHLLNRSKRFIYIDVPESCALWQVRVNGQVRRPQQDGNRLAIPVRPLRLGEATQLIELTWQQSHAGGALAPVFPRLSDFEIVEVLWSIHAPQGYELELDGDAYQQLPLGTLVEKRAARVVQDLQQLRDMENLGHGAVQRLAANLSALDVELEDHLTRLQQRQPQAAQQLADERRYVQTALRSLLRQQQQRADNRKRLGFDRESLAWSAAAARPAPTALKPLSLPLADKPWVAPQQMTASTRLGPGELPGQFQAYQHAALLGLDLLPLSGDGQLFLHTSGTPPVLTLQLRQVGSSSWWPWFGLIAALGCVLGAAVVSVRGRK